MLKEIPYNELSKEMLVQLQKGGFLTVKNCNEINTMTIGWGSIGFIWNRPVFMVAVRYSRYTYNMMEKTKEFTVSIPLGSNLQKELGVCGTKSKRDLDKFEYLGLTPVPGINVDCPVIDECDLHFECKIIYKQAMEPATLDTSIRNDKYSDHDYHVLYYGEILGTYIKE